MQNKTTSIVLVVLVVSSVFTLMGCNTAAPGNPAPVTGPAMKSADLPKNMSPEAKKSAESAMKYGEAKQTESAAQGNALVEGQRKAAEAKARAGK